MRKSLREWLEITFPQCHVIEAASGEQAISIAQIRSPQVVIMDINLPLMSGIEATRRIKAILPGAHVMMLTISEEEAYRNAAALAGAIAYVPKRTMQTELPRKLTMLLQTQCRAR